MLLRGVKTDRPLTDEASRAANYSNEGGVGYNRYQKNIMGMWLVNCLQRELCPDTPFPEIVKAAGASACEAVVDANAAAFLAPASMKAAFDEATGGAEIALATCEKMKKYEAAVWTHHGLFVSGPDFDTTFGLMHTIEKSAQIYVLAMSCGQGIRQTIEDDELRAIAREFGVTLREEFLD